MSNGKNGNNVPALIWCNHKDRRVLIAALLLSPALAFAAGEAEIVLLTGQGERRDTEAAAWIAAAVKQQVRPGGFVRTLANSNMGLLLGDRTQMRLNQNSQMQIKSVADSATFTQTVVRVNEGRAWSKAQPQTAPGGAPAKAPSITMETPSATMAIRGTDWEVEVRPDGSTQLVVLSGTVQMGNDHGEVTVEKGEAAIAAPGRAPAKFQLVNPQSRVQWVSSWKPAPRTLPGADGALYARAAALIEDGELDAAVAALAPRAAQAGAHPAVAATLARVLARLDRLAEARQLLDRGLAMTPKEPELLLAAGELAVLDGDVAAARQAFRAVLEVRPEDPEAWYGIGLIESERENVSLARLALDRSLAAAPGGSAASAERAAVESFAGNLAEARRRLDELLGREPANYLALTASGINLLKEGRPREALDAFLKAGTIEPRYARAWLYSGVAFYQLEDRPRAVEAFRKAAELDAKDPLPHLFESLAIGDTLDYGGAIAAAQRAQERMPNLKSLNQVANDQKGSANLGSALANFGMEEWAARYAYDAYSPFWAGSHLFLADRYTGDFNKNSELFKGFLTDPTAFGASNRRSTLIGTPGHYGKVDVILERADFNQGALIGTLNGLTVDPVPIAYFVSGDLSTTRARREHEDTTGDGRNITFGLGARPRHDFGLFAFGTSTGIDSDLRTQVLPQDRLRVRGDRADIGANLKLGARNQLWLKAGTGRQVTDVDGDLNFPAIFAGNGVLQFHAVTEQQDLQFRQSIGTDARTLTWGVEHARLKRPGELVATFPTFLPVPVRIQFLQDQALRSTDLYVSGRWTQLGTAAIPLGLQADLWHQSAKADRTDFNGFSSPTGLFAPGVLQNLSQEQRNSELNPRVGLSWKLQPGESLRAVTQRWRRPASMGTLGPVDTEGVALNDRLPMAGGLYRRARLQYDREAPGRYYFQAFLDRERIDNGIGGIPSVVPALDLGNLESLRQRRQVFTATADIEETPQFPEGRVNTLGLAGNVIVGSRQTLALRYLRRDNEQTGAGAGRAIPFVPRDMLRVASHWTLPDRWLLGANATWRSRRFRDEQNTEQLNAGWAFGFTAYWESADKRTSVEGILDNLVTDKAASVDRKSHLTLRYSYRF